MRTGYTLHTVAHFKLVRERQRSVLWCHFPPVDKNTARCTIKKVPQKEEVHGLFKKIKKSLSANVPVFYVVGIFIYFVDIYFMKLLIY